MIMSWTKCLFLIRVWGTIQSLFLLHLRVNLTSIYAFSHTAKSFPVFISIDNIIHESSMYLYIQSCCLWENVFFIIQTHDIIKDITPIFDTWQVSSSWQNPRLFYREDILTSERKLNHQEWNAENWTFIDIHALYTSYSVVKKKKKKHQSILFFSTSNQL